MAKKRKKPKMMMADMPMMGGKMPMANQRMSFDEMRKKKRRTKRRK